MTSISPHYHVKQTGSLSLVPRETVTVLEHSPVLTRQQSSLRSHWGDCKLQVAGPTPRVSGSVALGWASECISNKCPGATASGTPLRGTVLEKEFFTTWGSEWAPNVIGGCQPRSLSVLGEAPGSTGRWCSYETPALALQQLLSVCPHHLLLLWPCLPLPACVPKSPRQESCIVVLAVGLPGLAPRLPRKCDKCSQGSEHLPGRSQSWTLETEFPDDWRCCFFAQPGVSLNIVWLSPPGLLLSLNFHGEKKDEETSLHVFGACCFVFVAAIRFSSGSPGLALGLHGDPVLR